MSHLKATFEQFQKKLLQLFHNPKLLLLLLKVRLPLPLT
jgi:hypothetical protein